MSSSSAGAAAFNAGVRVNGEDVIMPVPWTKEQQAYLDAVADDAENAITVVEEQIAGMQESLKARKVEAERARAEAKGGVN